MSKCGAETKTTGKPCKLPKPCYLHKNLSKDFSSIVQTKREKCQQCHTNTTIYCLFKSRKWLCSECITELLNDSKPWYDTHGRYCGCRICECY